MLSTFQTLSLLILPISEVGATIIVLSILQKENGGPERLSNLSIVTQLMSSVKPGFTLSPAFWENPSSSSPIFRHEEGLVTFPKSKLSSSPNERLANAWIRARFVCSRAAGFSEGGGLPWLLS